MNQKNILDWTKPHSKWTDESRCMWLLSIAASYTRESRGSHELFSVAVLGITLLLWHFVVAPKQTLIFLFNWLRLFFVGRHMRLCYSNSLSLICQTFRQMFWFFINKLKARQFCIRESFVSRKQTVDKWSLCWHDLLTSGLKKNPMYTYATRMSSKWFCTPMLSFRM